MAAIVRSQSSPYLGDAPRGLGVGLYSPMRQPHLMTRNPIASKPPTPPRARHSNSYISTAFSADPGPGHGWRSSMKRLPESGKHSGIFDSPQGVIQDGSYQRSKTSKGYNNPNFKQGSTVFDQRPFARPEENPDHVRMRQSAAKKTKSTVFSDGLPEWGGDARNAVSHSAPVRRNHNPTFKSVAFDVSPEKPKPYVFRQSHAHNDFMNPEFRQFRGRLGGKKMFEGNVNKSQIFDPYSQPPPIRKRLTGKEDHHLYPLDADSNLWPMSFDEIQKGRGVKSVGYKPPDNDVFHPKTDYFWEGKPKFKINERGKELRIGNDIFNLKPRNQVQTAPRLVKGKPNDNDDAFGFGRGHPESVEQSKQWRQERLQNERQQGSKSPARNAKSAPGYDETYIQKAQQNRKAFIEYAKKKRSTDGKFSKEQISLVKANKSTYKANKVMAEKSHVAEDVFNPPVLAPRLQPKPQETHLYKMEDFTETKLEYRANKMKKNKPVFVHLSEKNHPLKPTQKARIQNRKELSDLRRNIAVAKMSAQGHLM